MKCGIRMIAIDLDGTLLNSQRRISEEDAGALKAAAERGVEIVPVTGRHFNFALPIVEMLPFEVPLITSNGAVIRSQRGETFSRCLLPERTAAAVLKATREFRPYTVLVYDQPGAGQLRIEREPKGASTARQPTPPPQAVATSPWLQRNQALVQYADSLEQALDGDPLQVMFAGPIAVMRQVEARLGLGSPAAVSGNGSENTGPSPDGYRLLRTEYQNNDIAILDAVRGDCSKGHALAQWSRLRGVAPAAIMAIGDNYNDLEMLRFAGFPVVMGNADELLKQQGWPVTLDSDSGGVAHAIRQYVL